MLPSRFADHGAEGWASRWPSCCGRETPDRTPPPSTSTPPGWPSLSSRRARGGVCWSSADSGGGIDGPHMADQARRRLAYSVGVHHHRRIAEAILAYPLICGPPPTMLTGRPAPGARVAEITGMLDLSTWPKACGSSSARNAPTPARSCGSPTSAATASPCFATSAKGGQLADPELRHLCRARCEDRIRRARTPAAQPAPWHGYDRNMIWIEIVALACELLAWIQMLALSGPARRVGTKKAAAADLLRRRAHRPRRSAPPALHRRPLALRQPDHRRHRPAGRPRTRLTSRNHPSQRKGHQHARGTPALPA